MSLNRVGEIMKHMHLYREILTFILSGLIILSDLGTDVLANEPQNNSFYSDNRGSFLVVHNDDYEPCTIRSIDADGKSLLLYNDTSPINMVYCIDKYTYAVTQSKYGNVLVSKLYSGLMETIFLSNAELSGNCFVADYMGEMYIVDRNFRNTVRSFDDDGDEIRSYTISGNIKNLFYYERTDSVYAVSDSGLFNITSGAIKTGTTVPHGEFIINGNLCTDSNGDVFKFDPLTGFEKIIDTDYDMLCPTENHIYAVDGLTVYELDLNGKQTAYMNISVRPEKILSSKDNAAYAANGRLSIIYPSEMIEIHENSTEHSSVTSSEAPSVPERSTITDQSSVSEPPAISKPNGESSIYTTNNYGIKSSKLEIAGKYIFLNRPMTLAEVKNSIEYNNYVLTVRNHLNKIVTSGNVGTNWEFTFSGNNEMVFYIVMLGDITGEGNINSRDVSKLSEYLLDDTELSDASLFAADIDQNEVINLLDLYEIYRKT